MEKYETLLKEVLQKVPKKSQEASRFVVPKANSEVSGLRTILSNVQEIANAVRRPQEHLVKFLLKELATKGDIKDNRLIVLGKFSSDSFDRKIELYMKNYVICSECKKPDTHFLKERGFLIMVCEACGARHSLGE